MTEAGFLETLKRVEDVAVILTRMEDINVVLGKITTIEAFIDRFGTLEALIERFESVENQLYYLKDMLNIDEAAKYLNISKGHMYRLTSNRDISYTKPNGKNIFFERKELDEWKRRNPVLSQRELERQAAIMTAHDTPASPTIKRKGESHDTDPPASNRK